MLFVDQASRSMTTFCHYFLPFQSSSSHFESLLGLHVEFNRKFIVPGASKGKASLAISNELLKVAGFFSS